MGDTATESTIEDISIDLDLCDYYYNKTNDEQVKIALMKLKDAIIIMASK